MNVSDASLVRAIRGPITLITLGVLFALNNFTPYQFHQTWPILLIVFGLLSLLGRGDTSAPRPYPQAAPSYPFPPPSAPSAPSAGSYRQSQYPDASTPAGPAKGGFGSSAHPDEPGQNPGGSK
jgi:hypothetical protein